MWAKGIAQRLPPPLDTGTVVALLLLRFIAGMLPTWYMIPRLLKAAFWDLPLHKLAENRQRRWARKRAERERRAAPAASRPTQRTLGGGRPPARRVDACASSQSIRTRTATLG